MLETMTHALAHRGPDDDGFFVEGNVGLGMRRLSIIDLSSGKQPIYNEDRSVVVVYNGEIYNYPDLKKDLEAGGHVFRTKTDTEVIVHLYEEHGQDFVHFLRGMFAIALWDREARKLILARDRLGIKPLFYAFADGKLVFGSEIKAILLCAPTLREVNPDALPLFFRYSFIPEPLTVYKHVHKLPAGHILVYENGSITLKEYWDLAFEENYDLSREEYEGQLGALLEEAVRIRLMSDVPLGAFLSGGVDSSAIVAYMSKTSKEPVNTFTIGFQEKRYDESADAERVAKHCRTRHHLRVVTAADMEDLLELLTKLVWHFDEPFGDSSAIPTYYVSKIARENVTVILSGDGGDETMAGYTIYQGFKFAEMYRRLPSILGQGLIPSLVGVLAWCSPTRYRYDLNRWHKRIQDSRLPFRDRYTSKMSIFRDEMLTRLFPAGIRAEDPIGERLRKIAPFGYQPFDRLAYLDARFHLLNDMLVKVDRMSMANSLEVRVPFLDHKLVEFMATVPPWLKLNGWETKSILRRVLRNHLPTQTTQKKKQGFGIPIPEWFREDLYHLAHELLVAEGKAAKAYGLNQQAINAIFDQHLSGQVDYGPHIWLLLNLEIWHRMYIENEFGKL